MAEGKRPVASGDAGITWRVLLSFLLFVGVAPAVLFISAGSLQWTWGWAYSLITALSSLGGRLLMLRFRPDLISERSQYTQHKGTQSWDRRIVPFISIYLPLLTLIVAGLNRRWGWSPAVSSSVEIAALLVTVLTVLLGNWAMIVNRFFSAVARIQTERGHAVVSAGPYRFIRHPGYAAGILGHLATALVLGSMWALIPAGLAVVLVIIRTALEDRMLQEELPGYHEYAQRVRYRLLPGIW